MKYRKRPVVIDAIKWTGKNLREICIFMGDRVDLSNNISSDRWDEYGEIVKRDGLIIQTLEGKHFATIGDYIIKGVKGEFYPIKEEIFSITYEPAEMTYEAV